MLCYQATASIDAPVETVWARLAAVLEWNGWTPTIIRVEALEHALLKPGRRFRVYQPKLRPAIWSVTAVQPPVSFTWEARAPGVRMVAEHALERLPSGHVGLTLRFSFGGLLGPLVGWLERQARPV